MSTPWDGATYQNGDIADGVGGGEIACATKKDTSEIWWRYDVGGNTWDTAPVLAGTVPDGSSKSCHTHLDKEGNAVITNGIDWSRKSSAYGKAGSWEEF